MDFIEEVVLPVFLIAGLVTFVILLLGFVFGSSSDFDYWKTRCALDKGQVVLTDEGFLSDHYECYKDGQIIDHVN